MNENQEKQQNDVQNPAVELGKKLRMEREHRSLSVGEVAERLKLSARQVEALESGNYEGLPELVFVRGFLRTYGRFLDMNEQEIADYLDRISPQERKNHYAAERKAEPLNFQNQEVKKPFPIWMVGVVAAAILAAGIFAWQSKSQEENEKQANNTEAVMGLNQVAAPNIDPSNVAVVPMNQEGTASAQAASATASAVTASAASAPTAATASATGQAAGNELVVKVRYRSVLVIKDKNGTDVINRVVPAGSEHRFQGGAPYNVQIGYALGSTVQFGSQEIAVAQHMVSKKSAAMTVGQ